MNFHIEPQPASLKGGFVCGDTRIALMDGHSISIAELVEHLGRGVHHAVYAIHEDGSMHMARLLSARRLSHDMEVVEVRLDDGTLVHCTPTQAFLGPDGRWLEAQSLRSGDALLTVVDPHLWTNARLDTDLHARTDGHRHIVSVRKSPDRATYTFDIDRANNLAHACGIILHD
ncbi:MAG: Hint domain-containing protein [Actinomycetota bacterium]|nr:Hint domain-containing protein [Actinomycetota bacterium]